jgi:hypothetical protein
VIGELAARMDSRSPTHRRLCATPLDPAPSDAAVRLLECLRSAVDVDILGPAIKREITYRVMCGPRGETLLAMLGRYGGVARLAAEVTSTSPVQYPKPCACTKRAY